MAQLTAPTFDPGIDGIYDLAPFTGTSWPNWTVQGDGAITIEDATAFIACWIGAHSSQSASSASSGASQSMGRDIPVVVTNVSSGSFETSVVLPADAKFDPSTNQCGNLMNVDRGPGAGMMFFTEFDAGKRTVHIAGTLAGNSPYDVGVIHLAN